MHQSIVMQVFSLIRVPTAIDRRAAFQAAVLFESMPCFEHRTNHGLPGLPLVDSSHPAVSRLSDK